MADTNGSSGKKKRNLSPETRRKLSEAAKKRVAEGKMGGSKFGRLGGRPRVPRASEKIAEAAQQEADAIIEQLKRSVDPDAEIAYTSRLKAIGMWIDIEQREADLSLKERQYDAETMTRDDLIKAILEMVSQSAVAATIAGHIEPESGIVDAEIVEDSE